jgi:O-antigen ligase
MSQIMTDAIALDAREPIRAEPLETAGFAALVGVAGALQFSIAAAQILLSIALVCWLLLLIVRRERFEAPHFFWPLLAYAGVTLFSAVLSSDVRTSLVDCKQLVLFLLVPVAYRFVSRARAPMLMTVILTCAAVSAAYGIVQYGILHYDYLGHRPQGTLGHYMTYSGLLMLVIAIAIARVLFGRGERTWAALVIPALTVAVALTFSRSATVGVCAAAALLFALKDFRLFAIAPVAAAFFFAFAPGQITQRFVSMFDTKDPTRRDRVAMLWEGERMILAYPLTGVGPNMVERRYVEFRGPDAVNDVNPHLHNVPIQIAAERGLPALAMWLWFIVTLMRDAWRRFKDCTDRFLPAAALAATTAMLTAGLFEYNFGDSEFLMLFLIVATLPFTLERRENLKAES